jgi:hypothetical protein
LSLRHALSLVEKETNKTAILLEVKVGVAGAMRQPSFSRKDSIPVHTA